MPLTRPYLVKDALCIMPIPIAAASGARQHVPPDSSGHADCARWAFTRGGQSGFGELRALGGSGSWACAGLARYQLNEQDDQRRAGAQFLYGYASRRCSC
jgi:hypothetical protein